MKKKILLLSNSSDGLYGFRKELLCVLVKQCDVIIAVHNCGWIDELKNLGSDVIETPVDRRGMNPAKDLKLLLQYIQIMKREKPDMVITYTIKPNIYGGMACRLLGIPYAANITGLGTTFQKPGLLRGFVTWMYRVALKTASVVFFENRENMEILRGLDIVREEQCWLLNGAGVNLEHFYPAPYPVEDTTVRFLFVGRIMAEKGINELLEAMKRLVSEGCDCTLDVLGYAEEDYTGIIRECEEAGWLRFHGYQNDVRPFIEAAHCFVLPSWHEGMANTNLECAAMARPVITSNIHGCKEAVEAGVSGLLCEAKNADSLYETMRRFYDLSHEERQVMGLAGRAHMERVFDKKKVVEETVKGLGL